MTTIFDDIQTDQPQTHFFIIGVGEYLHLDGGIGQPLPESLGLGQLSSPPISAQALANWVLDEFNNPNVPLGSIELLLSPSGSLATSNGQSTQVEQATFRNIKHAFDQWFDRCDQSEENIAIFYFCGHGIAKENLALLAADFGENHRRLFENSIDLETTHRGMALCKARRQCYFIDTCRQVLRVLRDREFNPTPLVEPRLRGKQPQDAPIIYASSLFESAYGLPNNTTRFTDALIRSLRGLGAKRHSGGKWVVTTDGLADAVIQTIDRGNQDPKVPYQECKRGGEGKGNSVIHILDNPPIVPLTIGTLPLDALSYAEITLFKGRKVHDNRRPSPDIWEISIPAAQGYEARAHFLSGDYLEPAPLEIWVIPPYVDELFEVEVSS